MVIASIRRLACLAALAALSTPISADIGWAQAYPTRNIPLIVPVAAGGPTDVISWLVAQKLGESWGHQIVVENIPAAGGNTGVAMAARSPADGYTVLVVSTGFMVNPSMYTKIPYDPIKDFSPITLVAASPNVISVHPDFLAKTLKQLVDLVKANPGKYSFAQPATGSTPHPTPPPPRPHTSPSHCPSRTPGSLSPPARPPPRRWQSFPPPAPPPPPPPRRARPPCPTSRMASCAGSPCSAASARRHCPTCRPTGKQAFPISRATRSPASWRRPARRRRSSSAGATTSPRWWQRRRSRSVWKPWVSLP